MSRTGYMREYMRGYRKTHKRKWNSKGYAVRENAALRMRIMEALGGPECSSCGCDELEILEINHINGGGTKESKKSPNRRQYYREILNDPMLKDKFNIMCKVCNILHYVRDILNIKGHEVKWLNAAMVQ